MQVRHITAEQLQAAANVVGVSLKIRSFNDKGDRHQVKVNLVSGETLRHYQRISASPFQKGRRINAVCWHGFRDFFRACYKVAPDAVFRTAMDTWKGSADFEERFQESGYQNIGSQSSPMAACEACTCPDSGVAN